MVSPLAYWILKYGYEYDQRTSLAMEALLNTDASVRKVDCHGRQDIIEMMTAMLAEPPRGVTVLTGPNESGKTTILSELLFNRPATTWVSFDMTTISEIHDLVMEFVQECGCRWLNTRRLAVECLPVAGSEVLVLKERFTLQDLKRMLATVTQALEMVKEQGSGTVPTVVVDGLFTGTQPWVQTPEGQECLRTLLTWSVYVTKDRQIAHVILLANEQFAMEVDTVHRYLRGNINLVDVGGFTPAAAKEFICEQAPDLCTKEVDAIVTTFGGAVPDLRWIVEQHTAYPSKSIDELLSTRVAQQCEKLMSAFSQLPPSKSRVPQGPSSEPADASADGGSSTSLDSIRQEYSASCAEEGVIEMSSNIDEAASKAPKWSGFQLYNTLERIVKTNGGVSGKGAVPYVELVDEIFDGDVTALGSLIEHDILGIRAQSNTDMRLDHMVDSGSDRVLDAHFRPAGDAAGDSTGDSMDLSVASAMARCDTRHAGVWMVTAASPLLSLAFQKLIEMGTLRGRMRASQRLEVVEAELRATAEALSDVQRTRVRTDNLTDKLVKSTGVPLEWDRPEDAAVWHKYIEQLALSVVKREAEADAREAALHRQRAELEHEVEDLAQQTSIRSARHHRILFKLLLQLDPSLAQGMGTGGDASQQQLAELFATLDTDEDGFIRPSELLDKLQRVYGSDWRESFAALVTECDTDGDDKISADEFSRLACRALQFMSHNSDPLGAQSGIHEGKGGVKVEAGPTR